MFHENVKFNRIDCSDATRDFTSKEWYNIGEAGLLFAIKGHTSENKRGQIRHNLLGNSMDYLLMNSNQIRAFSIPVK